jgi:hypothetical protein
MTRFTDYYVSSTSPARGMHKICNKQVKSNRNLAASSDDLLSDTEPYHCPHLALIDPMQLEQLREPSRTGHRMMFLVKLTSFGKTRTETNYLTDRIYHNSKFALMMRNCITAVSMQWMMWICFIHRGGSQLSYRGRWSAQPARQHES